MSQDWQGLLDQARNQASQAAEAGRFLDALTAYDNAANSFQATATHEEFAGLLGERHQLLARVFAPGASTNPSLEIIKTLYAEKLPKYIQWRPEAPGAKSGFEIIVDFLEAQREWDLAVAYLVDEINMMRSLMENRLVDQLVTRLEELADTIDDPKLAENARLIASYARIISVIRAGDYEGAISLLTQLRDRGEKAGASLLFRATLWAKMAECEMKLGNYQKAVDALGEGDKLIGQVTDEESSRWAGLTFRLHASETRRIVDQELERIEQENLRTRCEQKIVAHSRYEYDEKSARIGQASSLAELKEELATINNIKGVSVDGQDLTFTFTTVDAARLLPGDYLEISAGERKLFGQLELVAPDQLRGSGTILRTYHTTGDSNDPVFDDIPGDILEPSFFKGSTVDLAQRFLLEQFFAKPEKELYVGNLSQVFVKPPVNVVLNHKGFRQHTALFGQSGVGKSFALGRLLEELLVNTKLRIIVLDPNSDYRNLRRLEEWGGGTNPPTGVSEIWAKSLTRVYGESIDGDVLSGIQQDYDSYENWIENHAGEVRVFSDLQSSTNAPSSGLIPISLRLSDIDINRQMDLLYLDPALHLDEVWAYKDLIEELKTADHAYNLDDVERLAMLRITHPVVPRLLQRLRNADVRSSTIFKAAGGQHRGTLDELTRDGWRLLEFDIGELKPAEKRLVSLGVLAALWRMRQDCVKKPLLVVIDEAHHLAPKDPTPAQAATTEIINEIAGEGRKYGIYLIVVSQSPAKLHPFTLSQCGNLILMRMKYESDLAVLRDAYSHVRPSMIDQAKSFGVGEAYAIGESLVKAPVRFRFAPRRSKAGLPKVDL